MSSFYWRHIHAHQVHSDSFNIQHTRINIFLNLVGMMGGWGRVGEPIQNYIKWSGHCFLKSFQFSSPKKVDIFICRSYMIHDISTVRWSLDSVLVNTNTARNRNRLEQKRNFVFRSKTALVKDLTCPSLDFYNSLPTHPRQRESHGKAKMKFTVKVFVKNGESFILVFSDLLFGLVK